MKYFYRFFIAFIIFIVHSSFAQIPQTVSYQGVLSDSAGQNVQDGDYEITFKIYDQETDGIALWDETQNVSISDGIFDVVLGENSPLNITFNQSYWLGITIGNGDELLPCIELTASPYSLNSRQVLGTNILPADGNVGIGIINPEEKLVVMGTIQSTAGGFKFPDGTVQSTAASGSGAGDNLGNHTATENIRLNENWLSGDGGNEGVHVTNNGNVGIGISSPATYLHVDGSPIESRGQLSISSPPGEDTFISFYEGSNFKSYLWYDDSDDDLRLQNYNETNGGDLSLNPYGGNVGIGTTSPNYPLSIAPGNANTGLHINHDKTTSGRTFGITVELDNTYTGNAECTGIFSSVQKDNGSYNTIGVEAIAAGNSTGSKLGLIGRAYGSGNPHYGVVGDAMSNDSNNYGVYGFAAGDGSNLYGVYGVTVASATSTSYGVYADGDIAYTGSLIHISDQKFKENEHVLSSILDKIKQIQPKSYSYKTNQFKNMNLAKGRVYGVIAQEIEAIFPELVVDAVHPGEIDEEGNQISEDIHYKGVKYMEMIPILLQAVKELSARVEELESR